VSRPYFEAMPSVMITLIYVKLTIKIIRYNKRIEYLNCFVGYILYGDRLDDILTERHFPKVQNGFAVIRNNN
jgi:hypothetical protein